MTSGRKVVVMRSRTWLFGTERRRLSSSLSSATTSLKVEYQTPSETWAFSNCAVAFQTASWLLTGLRLRSVPSAVHSLWMHSLRRPLGFVTVAGLWKAQKTRSEAVGRDITAP